MDSLNLTITYDGKPDVIYQGCIVDDEVHIMYEVGTHTGEIAIVGGYAQADGIQQWIADLNAENNGFDGHCFTGLCFTTHFLSSQWLQQNTQALHKLSEALHDLQFRICNECAKLTCDAQAKLDKEADK